MGAYKRGKVPDKVFEKKVHNLRVVLYSSQTTQTPYYLNVKGTCPLFSKSENVC